MNTGFYLKCRILYPIEKIEKIWYYPVNLNESIIFINSSIAKAFSNCIKTDVDNLRLTLV